MALDSEGSVRSPEQCKEKAHELAGRMNACLEPLEDKSYRLSGAYEEGSVLLHMDDHKSVSLVSIDHFTTAPDTHGNGVQVFTGFSVVTRDYSDGTVMITRYNISDYNIRQMDGLKEIDTSQTTIRLFELVLDNFEMSGIPGIEAGTVAEV